MGDKPNMYKDFADGWKGPRERAAGRSGKRLGSYDANGNFIEGSEPPPKPKKPVKGSYNSSGKLIKAMTGQK